MGEFKLVLRLVSENLWQMAVTEFGSIAGIFNGGNRDRQEFW